MDRRRSLAGHGGAVRLRRPGRRLRASPAPCDVRAAVQQLAGSPRRLPLRQPAAACAERRPAVLGTAQAAARRPVAARSEPVAGGGDRAVAADTAAHRHRAVRGPAHGRPRGNLHAGRHRAVSRRTRAPRAGPRTARLRADQRRPGRRPGSRHAVQGERGAVPAAAAGARVHRAAGREPPAPLAPVGGGRAGAAAAAGGRIPRQQAAAFLVRGRPWLHPGRAPADRSPRPVHLPAQIPVPHAVRRAAVLRRHRDFARAVEPLDDTAERRRLDRAHRGRRGAAPPRRALQFRGAVVPCRPCARVERGAARDRFRSPQLRAAGRTCGGGGVVRHGAAARAALGPLAADHLGGRRLLQPVRRRRALAIGLVLGPPARAHALLGAGAARLAALADRRRESAVESRPAGRGAGHVRARRGPLAGRSDVPAPDDGARLRASRPADARRRARARRRAGVRRARGLRREHAGCYRYGRRGAEVLAVPTDPTVERHGSAVRGAGGRPAPAEPPAAQVADRRSRG